MIYVYDILLNFIDGNRIYEFFEWDNKDIFEHIKRIPLYKVSSVMMDDILNKNIIISNEFLKNIENKTLLYSNEENRIIKYGVLLSNGEKSIALELDDSGNIIYKSSLLLDEEEEVLELTFDLDEYKIEYTSSNLIINNSSFTRDELKKKNMIEKDLKYTYNNKEYSKLEYLYTECFGYDDTTNKEKYLRLLSAINDKDPMYRNKLNFILRLSHKLYVNK